MSETAFDESDCCGNGCANCVLNAIPAPKQSTNLCGKLNLIENYTKFSLKSKVFHSNLNDVLELHFVSGLQAPEIDDYILRIPSGHHVMMRAPIQFIENGKTKNLLRPYSPHWVDLQNLEFKILVNLKPDGPMSKYIINLQEGDLVEFRGPVGLFRHKPALAISQRLYIISQGVALAPTMRIIEEILDNDDDMTKIFHFACFVDLDHVYFRKRLREFCNYWNYSLRIYLAREHCGNEECLKNGKCIEKCKNLAGKLFYKEQVSTCRLTESELREYCRSENTQEACFVISGTRSFQDQMTDILKRLDIGANDTNICLL